MNRAAGVVVLLLVFGLPSCGGGETSKLEVLDARIGQPTGPNAALYFTASSSHEDRLIGASSDVAASIQIHETAIGDDGLMGMQRIEGIDVPAGEPLVLEPGGPHLMLIDVDRLATGSTVDVVLHWRESGDMTIVADVVEPREVGGEE